MKRFFTFLLFLVITLKSYSQEISIVVYKGDVMMDNKPLIRKTKYEIPSLKDVTYKDNSKFIVLSKSKYFGFNEAIGNTISYSELIKKLNQNIPKSFLKLMSAYHVIRHVESDAVGSAKASAKGLNDKVGVQLLSNEESVFPNDSARTSAKSLEISWKLKNSIMGGRLYVVNQQTNDTIYNQSATSEGKVTLNLEKLGIYNWFIYSKTDKKKRINQTFIRQSEEDNKKMLTNFDVFKKEIATMDEELKAIIINEYTLKYGIIE